MHKTITLIFLFLIPLFEIGCAGGPDLRTDQDPTADLAGYRTFGFFDRMLTDQSYSTITSARLKEATRTQLENLGYAYDEQNPDLRVNFYLMVVDRQDVRSTATPVFHGYSAARYAVWGGYPNDIETVNYKAGTLGVHLVDSRRNSLVWQGIAEGKLTGKALHDPAATVDAVITDLFREFPRSPVL